MSEVTPSRPVELPVACTLDGGAGAERLQRWRALSARGAPVVRRRADALVATYPAGPGVDEELRLLVLAERECCSFAQWEVHREDGSVVLTIEASADGIAAIEALFDHSPRRPPPTASTVTR